MNIYTARRKGGVPASACCCFEKPGHWASEGLDICYLFVNKQGMLIMELLATKDAVGVPSAKMVDRALEDREEDMLEDF